MSGFKSDILCISTQDFDDLWTRKQRFMKRFAQAGCRVLYVETQVHWVTYLREFKNRYKRIFRFLKGPKEVEKNLWVITPPPLLPFFQMSETICRINSAIMALFIRRALRKLALSDPIVYSYAPFSGFTVEKLGLSRRLYECVDEFCVNKGLVRKEVVSRLESNTIRSSDAVIVTAPFLYERKSRLGRKTFLIPNAVDVEHYRGVNRGEVKVADEVEMLPRPVIGFLGALAYWIDLDLIEYLARNLPDFSIVFIGPVSVNVSRLIRYRNVYFLGRRPYSELPALMAGVDVCINPYILDDTAAGCSPLKLYEYIASGKPIVSVRMPEAEKFSDLVEIADTYEEFAQRISVLAAKDDAWRREYADRAWNEAQNHTWESRFEQTNKILKECFTCE